MSRARAAIAAQLNAHARCHAVAATPTESRALLVAEARR